MALQYLLGEHTIEAVGMSLDAITWDGKRYENLPTFRFRLDNHVYVVPLVPLPGISEIVQVFGELQEVFSPQPLADLIPPLRLKGVEWGNHIQFLDLSTHRVILECGIDHYFRDQPPRMWASYYPERRIMPKQSDHALHCLGCGPLPQGVP